ncbi:DUF2332 domain-containing protein [Streptomyces massasporeus]|uniref:DUF2332 domain-containing protein n=1 Tax=Streptomyces massasporeus TaxID=67324 RepID=UPI003799D9E2
MTFATESIQELRRMADVMRERLPMSSAVLHHLSDDLEQHGPVSRVVADHPDAGESLSALRILAGVRLLVLTGRASQLAEHLEELHSHLGDDTYNDRTWELFRDAVLDHSDDILAAMNRPVQQHHPERAGKLLRGLGMLGAPRIRLLELGACAGLNLLVDKYQWFGSTWTWGDETSPVRLAVDGPRPRDFTITERAGCDLDPRNPAREEDAMILRSFLPHEEDVAQMELDDAIALTARENVRVDRAEAVGWLRQALSSPAGPGTVTVVWHSMFRGYLPSDEQKALQDTMDQASARMKLAHIEFEPSSWSKVPRLSVSTYF